MVAFNGWTREATFPQTFDRRQALRTIIVTFETCDGACCRRTFPAIVGAFKAAQLLNARHGLLAIDITAELGDTLWPAMSNAKAVPA